MIFRRIKEWWLPPVDKEVVDQDFRGVPFMKFPNSSLKGYLRRTRVPGKQPDKIEKDEVMYNAPDDRFFVGTGSNFFKIYETR